MSGRQKLISAAIGLYTVVAIGTFGHAAVERADLCNVLQNTIAIARCVDDPSTGAAALAAAVLWPLYWSWELQS